MIYFTSPIEQFIHYYPFLCNKYISIIIIIIIDDLFSFIPEISSKELINSIFTQRTVVLIIIVRIFSIFISPMKFIYQFIAIFIIFKLVPIKPFDRFFLTLILMPSIGIIMIKIKYNKIKRIFWFIFFISKCIHES
jgi:hypothetical protein